MADSREIIIQAMRGASVTEELILESLLLDTITDELLIMLDVEDEGEAVLKICAQVTDWVLSRLKSANLTIEQDWRPIKEAPQDGSIQWVYVAPRNGLPGFQCKCAYHPDAGWCADELREVTHYRPYPSPPAGDG